jgi:hypothetical protein
MKRLSIGSLKELALPYDTNFLRGGETK